MRPGGAALLVVNSLWSTPILSSTHSSESTAPVEMAVSGMSLVALSTLGIWSVPASFCAQAFETTSENWRLQRPSWITTGIASPPFLLTGTSTSVNVPSKFVVVETSGLPLTSALHVPHWTPGANGFTVPFGM